MNWIIIRSNIQFIIILGLAGLGIWDLSVMFHEYLHIRDLKNMNDAALCWDFSDKTIAFVSGYFNNYVENELVHYGVYWRHGIFLGIGFMILMLSGIQLINTTNKAFIENKYLKNLIESEKVGGE